MLFRNWMGLGLGIAVGVFSVGNVLSEAKADHNRFRAPPRCAPSHHHGHGNGYGGPVISNRPIIVTPYAYGRPLGYGNYSSGNYGSYYGNFNNGFNNSYFGNGFNGGGFNGGNWPAGPSFGGGGFPSGPSYGGGGWGGGGWGVSIYGR